jgi:hypothetical protein
MLYLPALGMVQVLVYRSYVHAYYVICIIVKYSNPGCIVILILSVSNSDFVRSTFGLNVK